MAGAESMNTISQNFNGTVNVGTARLFLRAARETDALHLHKVFRDSEVMRYWSTPPHENISVTEDWATKMTQSPQNGITDFVICLKTDQPGPPEEWKVIGKAGVFSHLPANEIGFVIAREYWRQGFAFETLSALLSHLFTLPSQMSEENPFKPRESMVVDECKTSLAQEDMEASKWRYPWISADVDPRNVASITILKKIGFKDNGYTKSTYQIGGEWVDTQWLALKREDFIQSGLHI